MDKAQIVASLLAGASAANSEFITVRREQLVAALTPDVVAVPSADPQEHAHPSEQPA